LSQNHELNATLQQEILKMLIEHWLEDVSDGSALALTVYIETNWKQWLMHSESIASEINRTATKWLCAEVLTCICLFSAVLNPSTPDPATDLCTSYKTIRRSGRPKSAHM